MPLREYQQRALDQLAEWQRENPAGNPCLVLPTGAGKSHIVAALCKQLVMDRGQRVLMLTHVKELIEQNAEKMREHWPNAPMGIYSAGLGKRQLGEAITFAGVQSVYSKADRLGHVDTVIIDECHLVSHKAQGGYRTLIDALAQVNSGLSVVGLTATPYRLGHGYITDDPALFDDLIEPVSIEELIYGGYLATLRSKVTGAALDVAGVSKRGGEYVEADLQRAVNTADKNEAVVDEAIRLAEDRKSWLFFCAGVDHAEAVRDVLAARGVRAACITGATPKAERAEIIRQFKAGEITALTNANVLTTGFDHPDTDMIVMMRPTLSASLYVQMAGRGMRVKSHTDHCLILDFAGVVEQHGPITAVQPVARGGKGDGSGSAPTKTCDGCGEIVHVSAPVCPACGEAFPPPAPKENDLRLRQNDIMGKEPDTFAICDWAWLPHISRTSGKPMLRVAYVFDLASKPILEYLPICHEGYAGQKAGRLLLEIAGEAGASLPQWVGGADAGDNLTALAKAMNEALPPKEIDARRDGKFHQVLKRRWEMDSQDEREIKRRPESQACGDCEFLDEPNGFCSSWQDVIPPDFIGKPQNGCARFLQIIPF